MHHEVQNLNVEAQGHSMRRGEEITLDGLLLTSGRQQARPSSVRWTLAAGNEVVKAGGPAEPTTACEAMASQQHHHQVTPDQTNRRYN
jgi:hypothetical protein